MSLSPLRTVLLLRLLVGLLGGMVLSPSLGLLRRGVLLLRGGMVMLLPLRSRLVSCVGVGSAVLRF